MSRPARRLSLGDDLSRPAAPPGPPEGAATCNAIPAGRLARVSCYDGRITLTIALPRPHAEPADEVQAAENATECARVLEVAKALMGKDVLLGCEGESPPACPATTSEMDLILAHERRLLVWRRQREFEERLRRPATAASSNSHVSTTAPVTPQDRERRDRPASDGEDDRSFDLQGWIRGEFARTIQGFADDASVQGADAAPDPPARHEQDERGGYIVPPEYARAPLDRSGVAAAPTMQLYGRPVAVVDGPMSAGTLSEARALAFDARQYDRPDSPRLAPIVVTTTLFLELCRDSGMNPFDAVRALAEARRLGQAPPPAAPREPFGGGFARMDERAEEIARRRRTATMPTAAEYLETGGTLRPGDRWRFGNGSVLVSPPADPDAVRQDAGPSPLAEFFREATAPASGAAGPDPGRPD